jgi:hypothetical protein
MKMNAGELTGVTAQQSFQSVKVCNCKRIFLRNQKYPFFYKGEE